MRKTLSVVFLFAHAFLFAQTITDDFNSDSVSGWIESNANHWHIDTVHPISGRGSLHHNFDDSESGFDIISYTHDMLNLDSAYTSWNFDIRYAYAPSGSNNWSVWFIDDASSDETIQSGMADGYLLGVNYTGYDDILKLWKQSNGELETVITTNLNWQTDIIQDSAVNILVERTAEGNWSLGYDQSFTGEIRIAGEGTDMEFVSLEAFGIYYRYTSTQDRKLWFDNLSIQGSFYRDTLPPCIADVFVDTRNSLRVVFNESVDTTAPLSVFLNNNSVGMYSTWHDGKTLQIILPNTFPEENVLEFNSVPDLKGNRSGSLTHYFNYYQPQQNDIIITEIYADPTPSNGLPECEYIEIYNSSGRHFSTKGWEIFVNHHSSQLPDDTIYPGNYMVISSSSCAEQLGRSIETIALTDFPALVNTGFILQLKDAYWKTLNAVVYSPDMFQTDYKKDGGWALEMIDVSKPCLRAENWKGSIHETGGTPGKVNSVSEILRDYSHQSIVKIDIQSDTTLVLDLQLSVDSTMAFYPEYFNISADEKVEIKRVEISNSNFKSLSLDLDEPLKRGSVYSISLSRDMLDCSGNRPDNSILVFGISEFADSADILINEILFEGSELVPEFIEIYNRSDKVIDLRNWSIATIDEFSGFIDDVSLITPNSLQVMPRSYMVFTEDKELLINAFMLRNPELVFEPDDWQRLSNDGGKISLIDVHSETIDAAVFNKKMHFALMDNTVGVSLERLSFDLPGNLPESWHSASTEVNYATPANRNSQTINQVNIDKSITVLPKAFTPDNDGYNDFLEIQYNFTEPGYLISIWIFDQNGAFVRKLVNNELCGISGNFLWDGLDSSESKPGIGYYIVLIEAVNPKGDSKRIKEAVLLIP